MSYQVNLTSAARRQLKKLNKSVQSLIIEALQALATNPRPEGVLKMEGAETHRIRVRDYRIVYEIQDRHLVVLVKSGTGAMFIKQIKADQLKQKRQPSGAIAAFYCKFGAIGTMDGIDLNYSNQSARLLDPPFEVTHWVESRNRTSVLQLRASAGATRQDRINWSSCPA